MEKLPEFNSLITAIVGQKSFFGYRFSTIDTSTNQKMNKFELEYAK